MDFSDIKNSVLQGDCRFVLQEIPDDTISACITDPPYNYEFIGHKWDEDEINRRIKRVENSNTLVKNIPYGSGLSGGVRNENWYRRNRNNIIEYQEWCYEWGKEIYRVCKPGAFVLVFNSSRTMAHVQVALERANFYARDAIIYRRSSGIPKGLNLKSQLKKKGIPDYEKWDGWHSCLRNEWEGIVVVQKPLINNYTNTFLKHGVGLFYTKNEDGSFQSNILENIPRDNGRHHDIHCTVKPLALMEKLVKTCVPPSENHIVLDPFAGTGTTLVAAKKLGRSYIGIEIIPKYIDMINKRLDSLDSENPETPSKEQDTSTDTPHTLPLFE